MNLLQLKWYAVESSRKNPTLHNEIYDIVNLAISEIEEGGSENHECELARRDIEFIVNEKMIEDEMEKINSPGEDQTVHGYSNDETFTMIAYIHNGGWMDEAFENIRQYDNPLRLGVLFTELVFKSDNNSLKDSFGRIAFSNINWLEIFENLKGMMPKKTYEELEERLALANGQAYFLFDLLRKLANGDDEYLADELFYAHSIKVITDITNDEYKFDK